jgi:peroxiredoxin
MVEEDDTAPLFTAPAAKPTGDIEAVSLSDLTSDGPVVLAFFPGAFTSVCTNEMVAFQDRLEDLRDGGADVVGVSIDSPFSLQEFADQYDLSFTLVGDTEKAVIDAFDVRMDFDALDVQGVAKRAFFLVDTDRTVAYAWVSEDPGVEPDYDEVLEAAAAT